MFNTLLNTAAAALLLGVTPLHAQPAAVQTPAPVIYLADNLDEKDNLGWCIDTVGRGYAETLHAHSCKPRGGDVQFGYNADSKHIYSVEFTGKCMVILNRGNTTFGLTECDPADPQQQFEFNTVDGEIRVAADGNQCVSVGEASRSAGPFMSRDLILTACSKTAPKQRLWRYKS